MEVIDERQSYERSLKRHESSESSESFCEDID
jgi:hypothetical protein